MPNPSFEVGQEMGDGGARSLLSSSNHGVLSLGVGNCGYGVPISFAYEVTTDRIVFAFTDVPGSTKRALADETEQASLTVYIHEEPDSWESVVVTGPLHQIDEGDVDKQVPALFFRQEDDNSGDRPVSLDEFDQIWYELSIDNMSGRHSGW
ncbi:MAG: pyridoxamine 5'-phosphate oxidase family protein [Halapricum sp.]